MPMPGVIDMNRSDTNLVSQPDAGGPPPAPAPEMGGDAGGDEMKMELLDQLSDKGVDVSKFEQLSPDVLAEILRVMDSAGGGPGPQTDAPPPGAGAGMPTDMPMNPLDQEEDQWPDPDGMTDEELATTGKKAVGYAEKLKKYAERYGCKMAEPSYPTDSTGRKTGRVMKMSETQQRDAALRSALTKVAAPIVEEAVKKALKQQVGGTLAELTKFSEEQVASQKKQSVDAIIKELSTDMKLPPREKEDVRKQLMRADARTVVEKFSEAGKTVEATEFDLQVRALRKRPAMNREAVKGAPSSSVDKFSEDENTAIIVQKFSESEASFTRLGITQEKLVAGFKAAKERDPSLSATEYLGM